MVLRRRLKAKYFALLERSATSVEGRRVIADALQPFGWPPKRLAVSADVLDSLPYVELPVPGTPDPASERDDVILLTARFRTGSTLLWNVFRHVPGCWAYYEPLNERRWFRPQTRGTDATHRGVDEYWREYDGLGVLDASFDDDFAHRRLLLDGGDWHPRLQSYLSQLILRARGRPVLKFNRVDFRLPWLRRRYPRATLIHLYRHPRDQWVSLLRHPSAFPPDGRIDDFAAADRFYLLPWANELQPFFPFLDPRTLTHPYELHYYLWRLSYWCGLTFADHSLSFESLVSEPDRALAALFAVCRVDTGVIPEVRRLIEPPVLGNWRAYAPDAWFRRREEVCEAVLAEFFRTEGTTSDPEPRR